MTAEHPVGTVLVHPEPTEEAPGRPQSFGDPGATRIVKIESPRPDEWPWRRLTGISSEVPAQGADLDEWRVQPLGHLAAVLGHPA